MSLMFGGGRFHEGKVYVDRGPGSLQMRTEPGRQAIAKAGAGRLPTHTVGSLCVDSLRPCLETACAAAVGVPAGPGRGHLQ